MAENSFISAAELFVRVYIYTEWYDLRFGFTNSS